MDIESCDQRQACSEPCADGPCLKPCVPMYCPANVANLEAGAVMRWCTCGLSKTSPWCDNSHIGTGFKPLKWTVPGKDAGASTSGWFSICACKYTSTPPYCDGSHIYLPLKYLKAQQECRRDHAAVAKLCTDCGFRPPLKADSGTQSAQ